MQTRRTRIAVALLATSVGVCAFGLASVPNAAEAEPAPETLYRSGTVEVRRTDARVELRTVTSGPRESALRKGLTRLAAYPARGDGAVRVGLASDNARIATGGGVGRGANADGWQVSRPLPGAIDALPTPTNEQTHLVQVPARTEAAVRFAGPATPGRIAEARRRLAHHLAAQGIAPIGAPEALWHDPVWMPAVLAEHEIVVEVDPATLPALAAR